MFNNIITKIFSNNKEQEIIIEDYKRFPFGETIEVGDKIFRYLYTTGENDVFFEENKMKIVFIKSKLIE